MAPPWLRPPPERAVASGADVELGRGGSNISAAAEEALPLLQERFGIGSVEDLGAVPADKLALPLTVDTGHVILCDKSLQTMFLDNGKHVCELELQAKVAKKLKHLGLEALLPDYEKQEPWWRKIPTGAVRSTSGVSIAGKTMSIGGEERQVTSCQPALLIKSVHEEGAAGAVLTEMTDEFVAKVKLMRDQGEKYKGAPIVVPTGTAVVYLKVTVDRPWDAGNAAVDRGTRALRDTSHGSAWDAAAYQVHSSLDASTIARMVQATQMALGITAVSRPADHEHPSPHPPRPAPAPSPACPSARCCHCAPPPCPAACAALECSVRLGRAREGRGHVR